MPTIVSSGVLDSDTYGHGTTLLEATINNVASPAVDENYISCEYQYPVIHSGSAYDNCYYTTLKFEVDSYVASKGVAKELVVLMWDYETESWLTFATISNVSAQEYQTGSSNSTVCAAALYAYQNEEQIKLKFRVNDPGAGKYRTVKLKAWEHGDTGAFDHAFWVHTS